MNQGNMSTRLLDEIACKTRQTNRLLENLVSPTGSTEQALITSIQLCDDVVGDGSNIVLTWQASKQVINAAGVLTSTLLGYFSDIHLTTPYTPLNPTNCNLLGSSAKWASGRLELLDGTWSPTSTMKAYAIRVSSLSGGAITFLDSFGNLTSLELNEVYSVSDEELLIDVTPVLTVPLGSKAVISYTQII
jgi:hypothetical protein